MLCFVPPIKEKKKKRDIDVDVEDEVTVQLCLFYWQNVASLKTPWSGFIQMCTLSFSICHWRVNFQSERDMVK